MAKSPSYDRAWWANPLWRVMHLYAKLFPKKPSRKDVEAAIAFYTDQVLRIMPCDECQGHYSGELAGVPAAARGGQDALFKWTVDLHNRVNVRLGKPTMTLEAASALYSDPGRNAPTPSPPWWAFIVMVTFVLLLAGGLVGAVWWLGRGQQRQ